MPGGSARSYRWFAWALAAVVVVGLAVRVAYVVAERRDVDFGGDAIVGAVLLRRRRTVPRFPILAAPAVVLVTVFITYGLTRFRFAAEPSLLVLAAVAIDAALVRFRSRRMPAPAAEPAG
jgi:hypothetical protein